MSSLTVLAQSRFPTSTASTSSTSSTSSWSNKENAASCNQWRSPIKEISKEHIATLPWPPLEAMLAAVGDVRVVRLVCKRCDFFLCNG
jgi:hypothetical protein